MQQEVLLSLEYCSEVNQKENYDVLNIQLRNYNLMHLLAES